MWKQIKKFRQYKKEILIGLGITTIGIVTYRNVVVVNPVSHRRRFFLPPLWYQVRKGNQDLEWLLGTLRGEKENVSGYHILHGEKDDYVSKLDKNFEKVLKVGLPNLIQSEEKKLRKRHIKKFKRVVEAQNFRLIIADVDEFANATGISGGGICITKGLYRRYVMSPDETTSSICHEIAHVICRHGRDDYIGYFWLCMSFIANIVVSYARIPSPYCIPGILVRSVLLFPAYKYGWKLPSKRRNEREADLVGLCLLAASGFHPMVAIEGWGKVVSVEDSPFEGRKYWYERFTSTHPTNWDRKFYMIDHYVGAYMLYEEAKRKAEAGLKPAEDVIDF